MTTVHAGDIVRYSARYLKEIGAQNLDNSRGTVTKVVQFNMAVFAWVKWDKTGYHYPLLLSDLRVVASQCGCGTRGLA